MTVVVAIPKGAVPEPKPILEERFNLGTAFSITPVTAGVSGALLLVVILVFAFLIYRFGRDRRYRGSAVDQAYGTDGGADELVPCCITRRRRSSSSHPTSCGPGSWARSSTSRPTRST
jgi:hypothetical protein